MIDISKKSGNKYFLFGSLYFSEGLLFALATVIIPVYLLDKGFSMPVATLVAGIAGAPWYLKFVFGPTIDYFYKLGKKPTACDLMLLIYRNCHWNITICDSLVYENDFMYGYWSNWDYCNNISYYYGNWLII